MLGNVLLDRISRDSQDVRLPVEFPLPRPWSTWFMFSGNGVRNDSQQLRDIQDLIAKLDDVNKKLALPVRTMQMAPARETESADAPSA